MMSVTSICSRLELCDWPVLTNISVIKIKPEVFVYWTLNLFTCCLSFVHCIHIFLFSYFVIILLLNQFQYIFVNRLPLSHHSCVSDIILMIVFRRYDYTNSIIIPTYWLYNGPINKYRCNTDHLIIKQNLIKLKNGFIKIKIVRNKRMTAYTIDFTKHVLNIPGLILKACF